MEDALTAPCVLAALLLAMAAVGKLRAPAVAAAALGRPRWMVRAFAVGELALAAWVLLGASAAAEGAIALLYLGFAVVGVWLWRRGRACGCFGADGGPVSPIQVALSCVLAVVSAAGSLGGSHPARWLVSVSPVAAAGLLAAAYAAALVYTDVPGVWGAWSGR